MTSKEREGFVYFGVAVSAVLLLKLIRRDFSLGRRCFPRGLPFPHQLMSHRGGSLENIENTLPAFRKSSQLGVDLLEMDVQLTRDGHVVVFHDASLLRMCGVQGRIQDFTYENLPPLLVPEGLSSAPSVALDPAEATRIPLLLEVLEEFPHYPMQIDVKNGCAQLVSLVGGYIRQFNREQFTVWGSFVPRASQLCYDHFGTSIPLFFCARRAYLALALYHLGLLALLPLRESALIVPHLPALLSRDMLRAMNHRGVSVILFGSGTGALNSEEAWRQARDLGANGICSDRPTTLQSWLRDSPLQLTNAADESIIQ